jgi:hypothetical protein
MCVCVYVCLCVCVSVCIYMYECMCAYVGSVTAEPVDELMRNICICIHTYVYT